MTSLIIQQQEIKEEKPKPKDIREVLKYVCSTKQTARKENKDIYISSLTDCTVKVTDFSCEEGFMGKYICETFLGLSGLFTVSFPLVFIKKQ